MQTALKLFFKRRADAHSRPVLNPVLRSASATGAVHTTLQRPAWHAPVSASYGMKSDTGATSEQDAGSPQTQILEMFSYLKGLKEVLRACKTGQICVKETHNSACKITSSRLSPVRKVRYARTAVAFLWRQRILHGHTYDSKARGPFHRTTLRPERGHTCILLRNRKGAVGECTLRCEAARSRALGAEGYLYKLAP